MIPGGSEEFCASGATCEFFLTCWLSGGLLESPCHGLLRGCCQRGTSKTGESGGLAIGTLEAPRETPKAQSGLLDTSTSKWTLSMMALEFLFGVVAVVVGVGVRFHVESKKCNKLMAHLTWTSFKTKVSSSATKSFQPSIIKCRGHKSF